MKVLLYLYYPFFDTHLAGGVQVWLRHLIDALQQKDPSLHITIYCPDSNLHDYPHDIDVNHVLLDLEQDFLTPAQVYRTLKILEAAEEAADIVWVVDRTFPIQTSKPLLLSLNTICYEREVMSIFQSGWSYLICPSDYVRSQLLSVIPNDETVFKIPFYIDPVFLDYYPDYIERVKKYFSYDPKLKYILFPHRPDRAKGHEMALEILQELLKYDDSYRLLIPCPPDAKVSNISYEGEYIYELKQLANNIGVGDRVIFHEWVDYADIPSYYSIGEFTLFLSRLPETFGLVLLNSVVRGTPTISFGVGALKEILPPGNAHQVIKNHLEAVQIILEGKGAFKIEDDINFLKKTYLLENVTDLYYNVFKILEKRIWMKRKV